MGAPITTSQKGNFSLNKHCPDLIHTPGLINYSVVYNRPQAHGGGQEVMSMGQLDLSSYPASDIYLTTTGSPTVVAQGFEIPKYVLINVMVCPGGNRKLAVSLPLCGFKHPLWSHAHETQWERDGYDDTYWLDEIDRRQS